MKISANLTAKNCKIFAVYEDGEEEEITDDLYFFEEQRIHNFDDTGYPRVSFRIELDFDK